MKKVLLFAAIGLMAISCSKDHKIKGKFKNGNFENTEVHLSKQNPDNPRELLKEETAQVNNQDFYFQGQTDDKNATPTIKYIELTRDGETVQTGRIVIEPGQINLEIDSISIKASGTPLNDELTKFNNLMAPLSAELKGLYAQYGSADDKGKEVIRDKAEKINDEVLKITKNFITNNASNVVGQTFFVENSYNLTGPELEEVINLMPVEVVANDEKLTKIKDRAELMKKTAVGQQFTDLTGPNPAGKDISLSDYVGKNKLVLVDFWASWCPPCRAAMPELIKLYNEYHKKGFEIVGVSLDKDHESWVKGIEELKLPWPQMSDLKFWNSELSAKYAVNSIPFTVLIDKDGKIIESRPSESQLVDILKDTLK